MVKPSINLVYRLHRHMLLEHNGNLATWYMEPLDLKRRQTYYQGE